MRERTRPPADQRRPPPLQVNASIDPPFLDVGGRLSEFDSGFIYRLNIPLDVKPRIDVLLLNLVQRTGRLRRRNSGLASGEIDMKAKSRTETAQESFWRGEFGDSYSQRNASNTLVRSNLALFAEIVRHAPGVGSIAELGCNIGQNLKALSTLNPDFALSGYEINAHAADLARGLGIADIRHRSIIEESIGAPREFDLTFTKGVLIHIDPESLKRVYQNLFMLSSKYILIIEYYNPEPVEVNYRGHSARLFKRDFAGEMLDLYDLELLRYGFTYRRDPYFPGDDTSWFLLRKH